MELKMSDISEVEKELSKCRGSKNRHRGKKTPEHIRKQAVGLLVDYSPYEIEKILGINVNTLKNCQETDFSDQIFIPLLPEPKKSEMTSKESSLENSQSDLSLKISNGNWSIEGRLKLQDWQNAIILLEGVK